MSSDKYLRIVNFMVKKDAEVFDSLLEYEKTGKIRSKERANFTIDKAVLSKFKKHCKDHGYSMSAKIEQCMKKHLENK